MLMTAKQIMDWQEAKKSLLLPIIYLRGFAFGDNEIDETTADPFNGFNIGSVLLRTGWTGDAARHIFESPILRLTQPPYNYRLAFSDGIRGLSADSKQALKDWVALAGDGGGTLGSPSTAVVAIYRYYDIDSHLLGQGKRVGMETYGWGLGRLICDVLGATCAEGVYLVAHSMGGLVARTFLQNEAVSNLTCGAVQNLIDNDRTELITQGEWAKARAAVRRFFTYGTPHNGITGHGGLGNELVGIIGRIIGFEADNFDRKRMLQYLDQPPTPNSLGGKFPVENTFCLIGTGSPDYPVAAGFSRRLVGQRSDGLVEIDNAFVYGPKLGAADGDTVLAARAYVRRAHSGPYGMVNSEEGFGNLSRFLFGDARIDADLRMTRIDLPDTLKAKLQQQQVRGSYSFETFLRVRGENWAMTERLARDGAAIFRQYDQMFSPPGTPVPAPGGRIALFTAFLDTGMRVNTNPVEQVQGSPVRDGLSFAFRLRIAVPDYEVNGILWRQEHYEGSSLLDRDFVFLGYRENGGWGLAWGLNPAGGTSNLSRVGPPLNDATAEAGNEAFRRVVGHTIEFWLPVREVGPPAVEGWLRLTAQWRQ